jgi:hypothetical protein
MTATSSSSIRSRWMPWSPTRTNNASSPLSRRLLAIAGAVGLSLVFAAPALAASTYARPTISATRSTFTVPAGKTATWTLRLWSHGTLDGSDSGRAGVLSVAVPRTSDCEFQADVTSTPVGGTPFFYSGWRTTMANCGAPLQTITGHIYLCVTGSPTTTEVPGGTLAANGPQTLASQANPVTNVSVADGTYTMTADAPTGFVLVACGGSASIGSNGLSASQSVPVPVGGAGAGVFYVSAPPVAGGGTGGSPGSGGPAGTASVNGATASSGSKTGSNVGVPTAPAQEASSRVTPVAGSALAFTGLNVGPPLLLGLMMLALGSLMMVISQRQRVFARRPVAPLVTGPDPSL